MRPAAALPPYGLPKVHSEPVGGSRFDVISSDFSTGQHKLRYPEVARIKPMPYKDQLVAGFWRYASSKSYPGGTLDRQETRSRPPVFTTVNADLTFFGRPVSAPSD
jgi:hypothetical protein